jgi:hypothetical protein
MGVLLPLPVPRSGLDSTVLWEDMTDLLLARIAFLEAELLDAHTDIPYGCLSRKGLERRYQSGDDRAIIFLDLDNMHEMNDLYTPDGSDIRISASLECVRASDSITGRWYSGDEIVLNTPMDAAYIIAQRLQAAFIANGLSATFGIAPAGDSLRESVRLASDKARAAKHENRRGTIN